jgi:hypothetical protein
MKHSHWTSIVLISAINACATPPEAHPTKAGTTTDLPHDEDDTQVRDETEDETEDAPDTADPADSQPEDEANPEDSEDMDEFQPFEGAWVTLSETMPLDGCAMAEWVVNAPGESLNVAVGEDSTFEIVDNRVNLECAYDETGFDCSDSSFSDTTPQEEYGLNATLILALQTYGVFDGPEILTMYTDITANCSGSDCWLVALTTTSFPCEMSLVTEAEAR